MRGTRLTYCGKKSALVARKRVALTEYLVKPHTSTNTYFKFLSSRYQLRII